MAKILNHKRVSILSKVKDTYKNCYPTDVEGNNINEHITFVELLASMRHGDDFYEEINVSDSIVRERIFNIMAIVGGITYDEIYQMWLNADELKKKHLSNIF